MFMLFTHALFHRQSDSVYQQQWT